MKLACALLLCLASSAFAADPAWEKSVQDWRARAEQGLRRDNGWLTLAGRFEMKPGVNTFGTGAQNDIVFPPGLGPERMGTITVEADKVTVKLADGLVLTKDGQSYTERVMDSGTEVRDWVQMGRASFHVIERNGRYILRLADRESEVRKRFGGRVWYELKENYRVPAKFIPHAKPRKIPIVNVLDEVSDVDSPGYVEFKLAGKTQRLDVVGDDDGLFFVFRDATAGDTTYPPGRFLYIEKKPKPRETFMLDLNRAYNPPCAFSEFTTCPLPPKQNILKVKVEAGEKYPPKKAG
ncbi:MAG TPA: DUF1684 domain-containing protein [Usitatibacter sp.]|nr:DUF1684 domain-containing protein [Usitatibacter sp.]